MVLHVQQTIQVTSTQDLDSRPCADIDHVSVLPYEMMVMEPGENPTRTLTVVYQRYIKCRTNDDRLSLPLYGRHGSPPVSV